MLTALEVANAYYEIRHEVAGLAPPKSKVLARHTLKRFEDFTKWCAKQEISDPSAFIRWRMRIAKRSNCIVLPSKLRSNIAAEHWKTGGDFQAADIEFQHDVQKKMQDVLGQKVREALANPLKRDPLRRRNLDQGQAEACAQEPGFGGFDPRSGVCPGCPQAVRCAINLNNRFGFDVVALRLGRLDTLPAEIRQAASAK